VLGKRILLVTTEEIISDITFIYHSLVKLTFKLYSLMVRGSYSAGFYCFLPMHARIWERGTELSSLFITEKILKAGTWASSTIGLPPFLSCLILAYLLSINISSVLPVFLSIMFQIRMHLKQCFSKHAPVTICIRNIQFLVENANFLALGIRITESPGI